MVIGWMAAACCLLCLAAGPGTPGPEAIPLWGGAAPGDRGEIGEEHDTTPPDPKVAPKDYVIRLGNVSRPSITVYSPPKSRNTGAAVIVCPGGGYHILAMNLEGTEICSWLTSIGVTAILLKYRVPARTGRPRHAAPLQDAQRAMGMVRKRAVALGIDPARIGVLGFSAGGHLAAALSTHAGRRTYDRVDDADDVSCRPDFTILIYPAYLTDEKDHTQTAEEIRVDAGTPQAFLTMTMDDPIKVENAFTYARALGAAGVPAELHVYPVGGHGYGLRPSEHGVSRWPQRAAEWLAAQGLLKPHGGRS